MSPQRILAIKLADLGDALTITPALRALRTSLPNARIDALLTPIGARALNGLDSIDAIVTFEKARYDRLRPGLAGLVAAAVLARQLRHARYDAVLLFHHLFTGPGRLKYAALLAATGAPERLGLAEARPYYLTRVARDVGYGVKPEPDYWLDVAELLGATNPKPRLEMAITDVARRRAANLLAPVLETPSRLVVLYPGAGSYSLARRWPVDRFADVGARLGRHGAGAIAVVGGPGEEDLAGDLCRRIGPIALNLAGQTDLATLAAVLERCDLFIGNDGGATHVASAVGAPLVAIFGPTNAVSWGPYGSVELGLTGWETSRQLVVRRDLPCSPCLYRGYLPGVPEGCPSRDCLTGLSPDLVIRAAEHLLQTSAERRGGQIG
jgi:heptosyltransferase-2